MSGGSSTLLSDAKMSLEGHRQVSSHGGEGAKIPHSTSVSRRRVG